MKNLSVGLLALVSFAAFGQNAFEHMPKGALRTGRLSSGNYLFKNVTNSVTETASKSLIVEIKDLKRQKNSGYTHNVGKYDPEATGRITDINTTFTIKIRMNSQSYECQMGSALLSDSFDFIGYDDARYTCEVHTPYRAHKIIIRDYSENRSRNGKELYELGLAAIESGFSGGKKTLVLAEILAK